MGGIKMKLGFIGAGNMGSAIIKGVLNQQAFLADEIYLSRKHPGKKVLILSIGAFMLCRTIYRSFKRLTASY